MTDDQIEHMVNRFLQWKLPENFNPDAGISFKPTFNDEYNARRGNPPQYHKPIGTNLFGASEAGEMVRFMLEGMPASPTPEPVAWRTEYRDVYNGYDTGWRHHYHSTKPHPAPLTSDGCGHRNVTPLYAAPEPSGAVVEALRACRIELDHCQRQLAAHGQTGSPGNSVSRALEAARTALASLDAGSASS